MAILKSKQARAGHAAGIYSDMTLDGPEIGTLVAVVDRAKNLPNRKTMGKQDPYCAMRLGKDAKKTDTDRRGGQTPKWDQELRFTVHESPDYYKLKCSVFNDDKKTELIGESWIDLTEVNKLGGGKSDQWHQLNFKGRYAGEIRIELTFYDTREQPQERKRSRDRQEATPTESGSEISLLAQRSLGPREIKRRPLPVSPAGPEPMQSTLSKVEHAAPQRPPKILSEEQQQHMPQVVHAPVAVKHQVHAFSPESSQQHHEYHEPHSLYQQGLFDREGQHDYDHRQQQAQVQSLQQYQQPWQYPLGQHHRTHQPETHDHHDAPPERRHERHIEQAYVPDPESAWPDEQEVWQNQRPQSIHMHSEPVTPQLSSPAYRPTPTSANSDSQLVRYHHPHSTSRDQVYTDSPLRQSISQHDMLPQQLQMDAPPPLPPKHRDTPPRRSRNEFPPSAYAPQPLRVGQKRSSMSDRSPLQSLEDDYDMQRQQTSSLPQTPQRHSMYVEAPAQQHETSEQYIQLYGRRSTYEMQPRVAGPHVPQQRPANDSRRSSYEIRHGSYGQQVTDEPQPLAPQEHYHSGHEDAYQPFVEDAPPSPGLQPAVARKAVGTPSKKLNTLPFGPDSYDVLNPASSPVTNERTQFQTPDQAKEAQRLREVEKIRELGPIIGNDGREIDPSDHLPADTWAPEPERKNRKPEHVIHIRSKGAGPKPAGARASPVVIRHNNSNSTPTSMQSSPAPENSPEVRTTPKSFIGGRNRLQKAVPIQTGRLSNQSYGSLVGAAASSPMLAASPQQMQHNESQHDSRPQQPRRPSYDDRVPSHLTRPPLSDYQVPVGNSYQPRSNSYDTQPRQKAFEYAHYGTTPTKQSSHSYQAYSSVAENKIHHDRRDSYDDRDRRNSHDNRSDYSYENHISHDEPVRQGQHVSQQQNYFDDPLAAEMSLIDIGPSRNSHNQGSLGRSMVRRW